MNSAMTISEWVDSLQTEIEETEWEWRSLDQQEWRSGASEGRGEHARAKQELEAEAGRLRAELAVARMYLSNETTENDRPRRA